LIEFFISFVLWNILNIIVMNLNLKDGYLKRNDMLDFRNRIVSIIHGFFVLLLSTYNTLFVHSGCGEGNTRLEVLIMNFSNGYFAYDFVAMAYLGILDKSMFIHHLICMGGLTGGLWTGFSADVLVSSLSFTEISNPSMHTMKMLRLLGYRYTKAFEVSEWSYMILYIFGRSFLGLPLLYRTWMCDTNNIFVKVMGLSLITYSFYYMRQMISILKSRAIEKGERKSKNIKMKWFTPLTNEEISKIDAYNKKTTKKRTE
jgi:hypothetical protein